jgi:hypothetical protein
MRSGRSSQQNVRRARRRIAAPAKQTARVATPPARPVRESLDTLRAFNKGWQPRQRARCANHSTRCVLSTKGGNPASAPGARITRHVACFQQRVATPPARPVRESLDTLRAFNKGWQPRQRHPGARITRYRCFLPDLAGFASYRREGADGAAIERCCRMAPAMVRSGRWKARGVAIWRRERDSNPRSGV